MTIVMALIAGFVVLFLGLMTLAMVMTAWPVFMALGIYLIYRDHTRRPTYNQYGLRVGPRCDRM